jgi:hypothetical protein
VKLTDEKEKATMRINFLYKGILVAATLCVAPAALPASAGASQPGVPTAGSRKGAFADHASDLLQQIQADALRVKDDADLLRALTREPFFVDWQADSGQLISILARVNDMDKMLSQLRANQSGVLPWQQKAIDGIRPTVVNLTNTAQAAIVSLNENQGQIYYSDVRGLAGDMYNQARLIGHVIEDFEKYANARHEAPQPKQTQGLKNNS